MKNTKDQQTTKKAKNGFLRIVRILNIVTKTRNVPDVPKTLHEISTSGKTNIFLSNVLGVHAMRAALLTMTLCIYRQARLATSLPCAVQGRCRLQGR